jgi:hypothetical protein
MSRAFRQLGGRRLLRTAEIHRGGFAGIADPQGATLALFEGETDP